jgi:hypothetical protein
MPCRHLITSPEVIVVKVVGGFPARAGAVAPSVSA